MQYEIKIVNRAATAMKKFSRAPLDEAHSRANNISSSFSRFRANVHAAFLHFFFFFFVKASNKRNFVTGYLSALTVPVQYSYPSVPHSRSPANFSFKLRRNSFSVRKRIIS